MTRRLIYGLFFTLATGLFMHLAAAEHPELTGTWRLDVAGSRFGAMPPLVSGVLTISTGSHKIMNITVSTKGQHLERTVETQWKIDDRYHPIDGDTSGEVLAKWEGSILTGKHLTEAGVEEIRFRREPDARTLTETIESAGNLTTLVWRRD